ncbi:hypothetical protein BU23DRAFT_595235 [Bimuria novae-zelandiae CBS 107.79]|uniref:Uncharacterized protein n=1 Tax=Bimuria novae-zelandiae CBS 107.79 TaxID=1447943 RepID=A0A6A5VRY3_9PLEO|nr:hypothetical protein BU23DRAFT_595235 [Bimuria novae-zelandiae CBS 107.79]
MPLLFPSPEKPITSIIRYFKTLQARPSPDAAFAAFFATVYKAYVLHSPGINSRLCCGEFPAMAVRGRTNPAYCPMTPIIPTRVLDLGETASSTSICVVYSKAARGDHVALSHCWGGRIETILSTQTVEAFQEDLTLSMLPVNFRDAVMAAQDPSSACHDGTMDPPLG